MRVRGLAKSKSLNICPYIWSKNLQIIGTTLKSCPTLKKNFKMCMSRQPIPFMYEVVKVHSFKGGNSRCRHEN